jgi:hypothetical protein
LLIGGLFLFIEYKLSDMTMFLAVGLPTIAVFGTIAFLRVNGMPFHYFFLNFVTTLKEPKVRIWARETKVITKPVKETKKEIMPSQPVVHKKMIAGSKLAELSLIVDTGGAYEGDKAIKEYSFRINGNNQN